MVDSIPGTRPGTDRSETKQYSVNYLKEKPNAVKARKELYRAVWAADDLFRRGEGPAVPCLQDPDYFTGDDLKTPAEAQMACSGCPLQVKDRCARYAEVAHPAWGLYAGVQYGATLKAAMEEGE